MISVEEAEKIMSEHLYRPDVESVRLEESVGRVLKEPIKADRDFPPFHRVSMDGIAILFLDWTEGVRDYPIAGIAPAGSPRVTLEESGKCLEVMTGAVLPNGTDTVIRYEDVEVKDGIARIIIDQIREKQNVHPQGSDREAGELLIEDNILISPAEIGVAASVGMPFLNVARLPKMVVISTGDELVDVDETPQPHQIRKSNEYQITSALEQMGYQADRKYVSDTKVEVDKLIASCVNSYDVIILSGGVSAGKFDYVPQALKDNGVTEHFHRIKQRPGKPLWFGTNDEKGVTVFALPGNPVSSFMCTVRYVGPWLNLSLTGQERPKKMAILASDYHFQPDLTYYLQVRTEMDENGKLWAFPETGGGSGDLANLLRADSFLELPRGQNDFSKGEVFPCYQFR